MEKWDTTAITALETISKYNEIINQRGLETGPFHCFGFCIIFVKIKPAKSRIYILKEVRHDVYV